MEQVAVGTGSLVLAVLIVVKTVSALVITGAIGGLNTTDGSRPYRYDIDLFYNSGPAWDLYILSLSSIQNLSQSELTSFFSVAGIHGFPRVSWDGVTGTGGYPGFCTHAATPFPLWHRPYVALLEQIMWSRAQTIATFYPNTTRSQYEAAALSLRVPYWDWMANPALPNCVTWESIRINTPDNGTMNISNPLYSYKFQSDAIGNGFPLSDPMANLSETVRWWNTTMQQSDQSAASAALLANANSILSVGYQMFSTNTNYTTFSCTWPGGRSVTGSNLENIHNAIHNNVGGYGHMTYPEVAAFDPMFFLHHANVDRLLAMWQALYPESYIEPTVNDYGSYYELPGTVDTGSTNLAPFHSGNNGTMWTMDSARSVAPFGYAYREMPDWIWNASQLANNVRNEVNAKYNPASLTGPVMGASGNLWRRNTDLATAFSHVTFQDGLALRVNNAPYQWLVKVVLDRYAYSTNFAIDFFMGAPPEDVSTWSTAANLIGSHGQFIAADVTQMRISRSSMGMLEGQISLTHALLAGVHRGLLQDLSPKNVVPLLQRGLQWRARSATGYAINVSNLTGLSVSVGSIAVVPSTNNNDFPQYSAVQWHSQITQGRSCGSLHCG